MTVAQLIARLQAFAPDTVVVVENEGGGYRMSSGEPYTVVLYPPHHVEDPNAPELLERTGCGGWSADTMQEPVIGVAV